MAKTICTPEITQAICTVLRYGAYMRDAARHVGIDETIITKWLSRGGKERRHVLLGGKPRKRESAFLAFVQAVEKAKSDASLIDLENISEAAKGGAWQASAWKLERRNPEQWGRQRLDIQAEGKLVVEGVGWVRDKKQAGDG